MCDTYGQAQKLEFCYHPSDTVSQSCLSAGIANCAGHDGYSGAFVEITNCADAYAQGAKTYFAGSVCSGQELLASCAGTSGNCFDATTYVHVFSSVMAAWMHQPEVQDCSYSNGGSCQNVHIGDQIGCVTVSGYVGSHGQCVV